MKTTKKKPTIVPDKPLTYPGAPSPDASIDPSLATAFSGALRSGTTSTPTATPKATSVATPSATTTPTASTSASTAFDPSFFNDYSQFAPSYTADAGQSNAQLQKLQDALAYVNANPGLPNKDYLLGELNKDIQAQQAVSQYDTQTGGSQAYNQAVSQQQAAKNQLDQYKTILTALGQGKAITPDMTVGLPAGAPTGQVSDYLLNFYKSWAQNASDAYDANSKIVNAGVGSSANLNSAQAGLLNNFTLPGQDWATAEQKLTDYYKAPGGQIDQSTRAAEDNIYQMQYNLKNGINEKAAQLGVSSSGSRQKALGNVSGQATQAAVGARQNADTAAQQQIDAFKQSAQQQQQQQQLAESNIKAGGAANIFGTDTQKQINAYDTNTAGQANQAEQGAQTQLQQQQASDQMWNNIFGTVGGAAAKGAGLILGV